MTDVGPDRATTDTPLQRVILFFATRPIAAGKMQQMAYLADLEHFWRHGSKISGTAWLGYADQAVSPGFDATLVVASDVGAVTLTPELTEPPHDIDEPLMGARVPADTTCQTDRDAVGLSSDEYETLQFIMDLAGPLTLEEVGALVCNTSPMKLLAAQVTSGQARWAQPLILYKDMAADALAAVTEAAPLEQLAIADLREQKAAGEAS